MTNEVTVITGASSGIGAALAKQLGSKGHQLVLAARREKQLKEVAKQAGTRALVVPTDVTRRADVEELRSQALKEYGHLDVWVNNAGRGITKSVLYGMQAIIPHFQERGRGHLINVSSRLGRVPLLSHRSIYSAAKSGVNVLTANARMDLKGKYPGIHVSLVMPGMVETDFYRVANTPQVPRAGSQVGPMIVQSAEEVAAQIVRLIENPVAELYTNPASADLVSRYYGDVGKFEENMLGEHRPASPAQKT